MNWIYLYVFTLQQYTYFRAYCYIIILDPQQQFRIDELDSDISLSYEYGVWTKYQPLASVQPLGSVKYTESNCSLIHLAKNKENIVHMIYDVCFDYIGSQIIHKVAFFSNKIPSETHSVQLEINQDNQYENNWFYLHVACIPEINQVLILITNYQTDLFVSLNVDEVSPFQYDTQYLQFGGSLQLFNSELTSEQLFASFPGQMMMEMISFNYVSATVDDILYYVCNLDLSCICLETSEIQQSFKLTQKQAIDTSNICSAYNFQAWFQLKQSIQQDIQNFEFLTLHPFKTFRSEQVIDAATIKFSYQINEIANSLIIKSYSYDFPLLNLDFSENNPFFVEKTIEIQEQFSDWHFITISKSEFHQKIEIQFFKENEVKQYSTEFDIKQFTGFSQQIVFGEGFTSDLIGIQLNSEKAKYDNCQDSPEPRNICHYSCQSCSGPLATGCYTCALNRQINPNLNICQCIMGFMEINSECTRIDSLNIKQVAYESPNVNCKFGEYQLENECYSCPSNIEEQYIDCYECVQDPAGWVQNPSCQAVKYYTAEQPVFLEELFNQFELIIVNKQISYFNYCLEYELIESGIRCLKCKNYYELKQNNCKAVESRDILYKSKENCAYLSLDQCYACVDPKKYHVSLVNQIICKECTIQYCEYCFEFLENNLAINSLIVSGTLYFDDIVQGCAKCESGYIFNFQSLLCEPNISEPNCIYGMVIDGEFICLETELPYNSYKSIQYGQCQEYINNCQSCIIDLNRFNFCIICEQGYYVQTNTGVCAKCELFMAKTCVEDSFRFFDYWYQEIQAAYFYFTTDHTIYSRIQRRAYEKILSCQNGYVQIANSCEPILCSEECNKCIYDNDVPTCVDCGINQYGVVQRSIFENKCIQCSTYCEYCQPQDQEIIQQWNPYFNSSSYLTHKCLKVKENSNQIHLEQLYGITKYCKDTSPDCYLSSNLFLNFNCLETIDNFEESFINYLDYEDLFFDANYLNFMAVYVFSVQFQFTSDIDSSCYGFRMTELQFQNHLKFQVYSITTTKVEVTILDSYQLVDISILIKNFNVILLRDLRFLIQNKNSYFLCDQLEKDYTDISILNTNITFESYEQRGFTIIIKKLRTLNINQLIFDSIILMDNIIIDYTPYTNTEIITISIQNLTFINCQLNNTIFLRLTQLENQQITLKIQNLQLINVTLHNSSIISFENYNTNTIQILSTFIHQSQFINSKIFNLPYKSTIQIDQFEISDTTLTETEVLLVNSLTQIQQFIARDLSITNSILIQIQSYFGQTNIIQNFTNFEISQCNYSGFQIIQSQIQTFTQIEMNIDNFNITNLQAVSKQTNSLINFIIIDTLTYTSTAITLKQINYMSLKSNIYNQVSFDQQCVTYPGDQGLIYISSFSQILLSEIYIINQRFIDITAIDIQFSKYTEFVGSQYQISNILQHANLNQIQFTNCILLKTLINHKIPMVSIQSDAVISIILKDFFFINNFVNYYLKTQTGIGNFLFVDAGLGDLVIEQLYLKQNYISNSSSTMLYINSHSLEIRGLVASTLNIFDLSKYQQFLPEIKAEDFKEDFLSTLFPLYSDSGVGVISVTIIKITDSLFEEIKSYSTSIFKIIGENDLQIQLSNFQITNISSSLVSKASIYGCFLINALKSNLNLQINDMTVKNVFNKLESAFLTVIASDTENQIIFENLSFVNVLSLKNSIFEMSTTLSKMNFIKLNNVTIKVSEHYYYSFFQQIQTLELEEKDQLGTLNALIFIQSSKVTISNLLAQGYYNIPIIQIVKSSGIKLKNVQFHNIHTLQSLLLIQSLSVSMKHLQIQQLVISKVFQGQIQQYNSSIQECPQVQVYSYKTQSQCQIQYDLSTAQMIYDSNSLMNLNKCNSQIFTQLEYSLDSLIMIDVQQILLIKMSNIMINRSHCKYCSLGLLVFKSQQILQKLNIDTLQCFNNNMNNYGCIYIQGMKSNNQQIVEMNTATFISNICDSGCALTTNNQSLTLQNTKILKNIAAQNGGGINEISDTYNITQNNVIFLDNQAQFGGAIYIKSKILNITQLNMVYYSNNTNVQIYDQPIILCLGYFDITISSLETLETPFLISKPNYVELSQILKNNLNQYFMVPSNQYCYEYKFFNSTTRVAQQSNITLYFQAQNQFYEIITDLVSSICLIQQRDFDIDLNQPLSDFQEYATIDFDMITQSFRLDQLLFSINPYQSLNIVRQLQLQCSSIYNANYRYLINLRTYFCQIGEYFVDDGCLLCQSQKGQYSVKANQTKCQQADFQMVKNITETDIELLPGKWRPSYDSELIEICIRKQIYCKGGWVPGKDSCLTGHLGALCEECDISNINGENHFYKDSEAGCVNCKFTYQPIVTILVLSLWTILSIFLTTKSIEQSFHQFYKFQQQSKHYIVLYKYSQNMASCLIKIAVNQLLVISSIVTNSISFNINISFLFYVSSPALTNSYNLDCFLADFADQFGIIYVRQFTNLVVPFIYVNIYFFIYFTQVIYKKINFYIRDLYTPIIYIFVITQPDIIKYCGSLLASRFISGFYWIQADVSLLYWTDNHQKWIFYSTLPILCLLSLIIPVFFFYQLWKNKNHLRKKDFRKKWCYLYDEYTEKSYYWEILKIVQRQLQILVLTIFYDNVILKSSLLIFIQSIYLLVIIKQQPFNTKKLNTLEIRCVSLCVYILIVTLIISNAQVNNQIVLFYISQICLFLLILGNILPIIYQILLCYLQKYLDDIIILLNKLSAKFPIFKFCFGQIVNSSLKRIAKKSIIRQRYNILKSYLLKQSKQILEIKNGTSTKKEMRSTPSQPNLQVSIINQDQEYQQILQLNQQVSANNIL